MWEIESVISYTVFCCEDQPFGYGNKHLTHLGVHQHIVIHRFFPGILDQEAVQHVDIGFLDHVGIEGELILERMKLS